MPTVRAGRLRDKVTIYGRRAADSYGQESGARTALNSRSCDILPRMGKEVSDASGEHVITFVDIRFRYEENLVKSEYELIDYRTSPATVYDVQDVTNVKNRNRELVARCKVVK